MSTQKHDADNIFLLPIEDICGVFGTGNPEYHKGNAVWCGNFFARSEPLTYACSHFDKAPSAAVICRLVFWVESSSVSSECPVCVWWGLVEFSGLLSILGAGNPTPVHWLPFGFETPGDRSDGPILQKAWIATSDIIRQAPDASKVSRDANF